MTQGQIRYADWKAPSADAEILLWPNPPQVLQHSRDNFHRLRTADIRIQNVPLRDIRQRQRETLAIDPDAIVIATGHQAELFHPGVWAKLAMIDAAARATGGLALHLAVDTDAPKHLNLRWPGYSEPISDDPRITTAQWAGLLQAPSPAYLQQLAADFTTASAAWPFDSCAGRFLSHIGAGQPLPGAITQAMHALDSTLDLRYRAQLASPLWSGPAYLLLVHHLLARAGEFTVIYNQALADYRATHRIRTTARPMPDLLHFEQAAEAPFWFDDLTAQTRDRATVERGNDGDWALRIAGETFPLRQKADGFDAAQKLGQFLDRHQVRLSPRALTLTLFARLLLVDQFVHGIGGGRYDQVTDQVIHRFIGLPPPDFAVATATLYFPTAAGRSRPCLPCIEQEGHRLRHRLPEDRKMQFVRDIQNSPRRSPQRQRLFSEMHTARNTALLDSPLITRWQQRLAAAQRQDAHAAPLFDREIPYVVQSPERLNQLIEAYRARFE